MVALPLLLTAGRSSPKHYFLQGDTMGEREAMLDEVFRLTNEQTKALGRRLSDEEMGKCRLRAQRIEELLERIKYDGFSKEQGHLPGPAGATC